MEEGARESFSRSKRRMDRVNCFTGSYVDGVGKW